MSPPAADTEVTPSAPAASGNDITIPTDAGVDYKVDGTVVTGTYTMTADTTVTASPQEGYVFSDGATTSWQFTFTG